MMHFFVVLTQVTSTLQEYFAKTSRGIKVNFEKFISKTHGAI